MTQESAGQPLEKTGLSLGLALSGGGARGLAHIGVLAALEEAGVQPDIVTGTSAGSLVGAFYLAGWDSTRILSEFKEMSWGKYLSVQLLDPMGVMDSSKIEDLLTERIGDLRIEELGRPYMAVAVDLLEQETVRFADGPLAPAVRASCALPGVFSPYVDDRGRILVDGGLITNLPVDEARELGADLVLAVDVGLSGKRPEEPPQNLFDVLEYSLMITRKIATYTGEDPDWLVRPDVQALSVTQVINSADKFVEAGYESAQAVMSQVLEALGR
jgi:NTE family protein